MKKNNLNEENNNKNEIIKSLLKNDNDREIKTHINIKEKLIKIVKSPY